MAQTSFAYQPKIIVQNTDFTKKYGTSSESKHCTATLQPFNPSTLQPFNPLTLHTFLGIENGARYARLSMASASLSLTNFSFFGSKVKARPVR